ncbi:putative membrane protein YhiD involved in acid resistance [Paenibacillus forsythiae]|uniref:Membrane protein YhiD involved in acid resistance n=1 Tax=Paenibacillus forsythiae TaxID=365616 RepID=A0ABU3H1M2_9BACL|nr:DUF4956 domain-containing protein [Paenibacillus forsythiae]MDT3424714.1 putative membrane protein YhiD involved in acid resistance [Paenibacillus forsythiae]
MDDTINFQDLFKKSVLHLDAFRTVSYIDVLLGLFASLGVGLFIFYIYRKTFRGVVYSYNYNAAFVLMCMITSMIIMTISSNIVLSLGMVGALSIVRFRTAVKDPLDIVYMFWSIAGGIATGAKLYPVALIGSLAIGLVLLWLSRRRVREQPYLLIVRHSEEATTELRIRMRKIEHTLRSKTIRKDFIELTVELRLRDSNTAFVHDLSSINGVMDVSLINYTGDYAQ